MSNVENNKRWHKQWSEFKKAHCNKQALLNKFYAFIFAAVIVLLCSVTMSIYCCKLTKPTVVDPYRFINISIDINQGISFGNLNGKTWLIYILQSVLIVVLFIFTFISKRFVEWFFGSMAYIGATYNLVDRMVIKEIASLKQKTNGVLDYFQFFDKSAIFNFPDFFIITGIIGICLFSFIFFICEYKQKKKNEEIKK
ncbi:prolipoprotein signal peptidase [Candidatus Malacoplasma girerdii]|uniref:Prolipoprotein signal peptidase n=1 Tax=Candidatus Malacoplasma girerdii TaxID=1318617 RepID=A0A097SSU1_9BACT|nr:prolipoprotein signal peptidase [Candidatus Malacoplasma girerdii]ASJ89182.1 MAG: lipoprotein signal peptidase [Candidatus Malacoplasma girerdii]